MPHKTVSVCGVERSAALQQGFLWRLWAVLVRAVATQPVAKQPRSTRTRSIGGLRRSTQLQSAPCINLQRHRCREEHQLLCELPSPQWVVQRLACRFSAFPWRCAIRSTTTSSPQSPTWPPNSIEANICTRTTQHDVVQWKSQMKLFPPQRGCLPAKR